MYGLTNSNMAVFIRKQFRYTVNQTSVSEGTFTNILEFTLDTVLFLPAHGHLTETSSESGNRQTSSKL